MARRHINGAHVGELMKSFKGRPMEDRVPFFVKKDGGIHWLRKGTSHESGLGIVNRKEIKHMGFVIRSRPDIIGIGRESMRFGNMYEKVPDEVVNDIESHINSEIDRVHGKDAHKKYDILKL